MRRGAKLPFSTVSGDGMTRVWFVSEAGRCFMPALTDRCRKPQDMQSRSHSWTPRVAFFLASALSLSGGGRLGGGRADRHAVGETGDRRQPTRKLSFRSYRQRRSGHARRGSLLPGGAARRSPKSRSPGARLRRSAVQWRRSERRLLSARGCLRAIRTTTWRALRSRCTISDKDNLRRREPILGSADASRARDVTTALLTAWSYAGQSDLHHALDALDRIHDRSVLAFRDYHAGLIAGLLGNSAEAERRLKSAYDNDKNSLRFADAYARVLAGRRRCRPERQRYTRISRLLFLTIR